MNAGSGCPSPSALQTDVETLTRAATLNDFVWNHSLRRKELSAVVVEDGRYLGMCRVHDASEIERDQWNETTVESIMLPINPARLSMTLREATLFMEEQDVEQIPVTDGTGRFVGVVTEDAILKLDEILEETSGT